MQNHLPKAFILGTAIAAFAAQQASATLTIDLRASLIDGLAVTNPKSIDAQPGQTITFDVYAVVTTAVEAPGLEGLQIVIGSIKSAAGGALGSIITNEFVAPFAGPGSTIGLKQDLDSDTDIDLGSNATALNNDFLGARSASMTTGNPTGLGPSEFKFYSFTFRVANGATGATQVNWRKTDLTGLTTEYIWQENGVLTNSRGVNGGSVPLVQTGPDVLVAVPEPSAFGMVLMGVMGIVGFRRMGFRRS